MLCHFEGRDPLGKARIGRQGLSRQQEEQYRDRSENGLEFEERFQKFVLCPELGEAFEKELVIVLDDDSQSRLIWVDHGTGRANETTVLQSDIKTAAQSFSAWLKSFYE